jgi:hypothetical protein
VPKVKNRISEPWERQPGESVKAFAAFAFYRDLGPGERSTARVRQKYGKNKRLIDRWSSAYDWVKRCAAWDSEVDRQAREAAKKEVLKARKNHARMGAEMVAKAARALMALSDGDITAADITRMADIGAKLERLALGDIQEQDRQRLELERERLELERRRLETAKSGLGSEDYPVNFVEILNKLGRPGAEQGPARNGNDP